MDSRWSDFEVKCNSCRACALAEGRQNVVIGRGSREADILLVGEGPGQTEDQQGLPFVGQAGKLLDMALESCLFEPASYYIANVVKCRPPQNRTPLEDECKACLPLLRQQFTLIRPLIIVCLGAVALATLISPDMKISQVRGTWFERKGVLFMPTYHPAALLRNQSLKIFMWKDLKCVYNKWLTLKS